MEKTIKKIGDTKMSTIKDKKGKDLMEAEDIKKRWQDYAKEQYLKVHNELITTMMWSLTQRQTFWSVKSSSPQEALLWTKLVEVT